ncbi:SIR2 family protein [Mycobacteroides abscessus]|uniref:SIR2 family protein n=1 Tax=Mycobacteroides abscessus TaxID=36809 RepID=UPI000C26A19B|nr:SIR2 family protein [Mycobacteroides abscessus]RIR68063.1 hypothetical protein D2E62_03095 [Mycobacteroides abscessus]
MNAPNRAKALYHTRKRLLYNLHIPQCGGRKVSKESSSTASRRDHQVGFFDCACTDTAIADLSEARSLTFFLGAGVSADQDVPTWAVLVHKLMKGALSTDLDGRPARDRAIQSNDIAKELIKYYFQLPMATAVDGLLKAKYGKRSYVQKRNSSLRRNIYKEESGADRSFLRNPSLAREVVLTAILLKGSRIENDPVGDVHIVTTNYDYAVEEIARDDIDARREANYWGIRFKTYADSPPEDVEPGEIPVVHIHGAIGRQRGANAVVFSEPDYSKWFKRGEVLDYVRRRFAESHLLMLGASLRDHNIISYLSDTNWNSEHRYAMLPLQGDSAYEIGKQMGFDLISRVQARRAEEIGIRGIFPDFFGQVHQFLIELRVAAMLQMGGIPYEEDNYSKRIRRWARDFERHATNEQYRISVTKQLRALATQIKNKIPEADRVKIEVWVRRNIEDRTIELWCNSQSTLLGKDYWPNERRIDSDTAAPAVHSFSNRTAVHDLVTDRQDGRWTHYLASTILIDQSPYWSLPIGAAVILFHAPNHTEHKLLPSIEPWRGGLIRYVLDTVEPILQPDESA